MEKRLTAFLLCLLLSIGVSIAQNKITGTVISQDDGEPIIGQPEKYFWIDLDTGETVIYDFNFYPFNKTISTEKMTLKVTKVH